MINPILSRTIRCPECQVNTMRKSHGHYMLNREYFCDSCHQYFGIWQLTYLYHYDMGDFYGEPKYQNVWVYWWEDSDNSGEPVWSSLQERKMEYETVTSMIFGIPVWCLENSEVDRGFPY